MRGSSSTTRTPRTPEQRREDMKVVRIVFACLILLAVVPYFLHGMFKLLKLMRYYIRKQMNHVQLKRKWKSEAHFKFKEYKLDAEDNLSSVPEERQEEPTPRTVWDEIKHKLALFWVSLWGITWILMELLP